MPETLGRVNVDVVGIMPRCRDCRFWQTSSDGRNWLPRSDGRGHCMIAETLSSTPVEPTSLAFAEDGESYLAVLVTAPDFGCVQWEKKPDA